MNSNIIWTSDLFVDRERDRVQSVTKCHSLMRVESKGEVYAPREMTGLGVKALNIQCMKFCTEKFPGFEALEKQVNSK